MGESRLEAGGQELALHQAQAQQLIAGTLLQLRGHALDGDQPLTIRPQPLRLG